MGHFELDLAKPMHQIAARKVMIRLGGVQEVGVETASTALKKETTLVYFRVSYEFSVLFVQGVDRLAPLVSCPAM